MKYIMNYVKISIVLLAVAVYSNVYAQLGVIDLSHAELAQKIAANPNAVIIDVRSAGEFAQGRVPNAINIPHGDILDNISLLDQYQGKDLVFYCRSGVRAGRVTDLLTKSGFTGTKAVYHLDGDMLGWQAANQVIEK